MCVFFNYCKSRLHGEDVVKPTWSKLFWSCEDTKRWNNIVEGKYNVPPHEYANYHPSLVLNTASQPHPMLQRQKKIITNVISKAALSTLGRYSPPVSRHFGFKAIKSPSLCVIRCRDINTAIRQSDSQLLFTQLYESEPFLEAGVRCVCCRMELSWLFRRVLSFVAFSSRAVEKRRWLLRIAVRSPSRR